jgi:hypothetical protein
MCFLLGVKEGNFLQLNEVLRAREKVDVLISDLTFMKKAADFSRNRAEFSLNKSFMQFTAIAG